MPKIVTLSPSITEVSVNGHKYVFQQNARGDYVADLTDADAVTIQTVSAGYQPYPDDPEPEVEAAPAEPAGKPPEPEQATPEADPVAVQ